MHDADRSSLVRLWSLDPTYLDRRALVATWREGLLARAVLRGATRGYRHHPQLDRFRAHATPVSAVNAYLGAIADEAEARGYRFDRARIGPVRRVAPIPVTRGQLAFELEHLRSKVVRRAPAELVRLPPDDKPVRAHPSFRAVDGPVEPWERAAPTLPTS